MMRLHLSGYGFEKIGFVNVKDVKIGNDDVDILVETFTNVKIDDLEILKIGLEGVVGFIKK